MKESRKTMKEQTKMAVIVLVTLLVVGAMVAGILVWRSTKKMWYDVNATEFTITTTDELYELAELSKNYDFAGQTIKLGADIVVNKGDATKWDEAVPSRVWKPITGFAGTFDGQGHTISGLYGDGVVTSMGLFTDTKKGAVIRNLKLVNSYFKNGNNKGTGSIIGFGGGTLDTVYSDAIVVGANQYVGGLIGKITVKAENRITNSWFNGSVTVKGIESTNVGGLVGAIEVADAVNTIEHSLNTGSVTSASSQVGGLCGNVGKGSFLRMTDSMSSGTINYGTDVSSVGSVLGQIDSTSSFFVSDTYAVKEIKNETIGNLAGSQNGNVIKKTEEMLTGYSGYQWTMLDFENYWAVRIQGTPVLACFAEEIPGLAGIAKKIDTSWYDAGKNEFVITTAEELYGLAYLSLTESFAKKTIKLGADIVVNEGDSENWKKNSPTYDWEPIGWHGSNTGQHFAGNFDGQGHSISGIYVKGDENAAYLGLFGEVYREGSVKNLILTNSYIEGTGKSSANGIVGSVAGRLLGTIDTVYSDATVIGTAKFTGGLVGMITGAGENTITNSWYAGKLYGAINSGGILGGVFGDNKNISAYVSHCLNTGALSLADGSLQAGGLVGTAQRGSTLYLSDCLSTGTIELNGTVRLIGSIAGYLAKDSGGQSTIIFDGVYGLKETCQKLMGSLKGISTGLCVNVERATILGNGAYKWTTLDFNKYWAAQKNETPILASFADSKLKVSGKRMIDSRWYNPEQNVYTLTTAEQLFGFAQISKVTTFEGKTIKLGADIVLNEGNAADWATQPPENEWIPIGYQSADAHFKGVFDGQGHTISGIYVKGDETEHYLGLFAEVYRGATVKNLTLTNSYIEGTGKSSENGIVGSVAGRLLGTIDTVYSDATVVGTAKYTGGLVGMITGDGENTITNSWYAGKLYGAINSGGILGGVFGNNQNISAYVSHCLNTGALSLADGSLQAGGLVGTAQRGSTLYLSDCLSTGTIELNGTVRLIGSIAGYLAKDSGGQSTIVFDGVYGLKETCETLMGSLKGISTGLCVNVERATILGNGAYKWTTLDFNKYWAAQKNETPILASFADSKLQVSGKRMIDVGWYAPEQNVYTLTTAEQLFGFAQISKVTTFEDKTIKLGADIVLNEGNAADWATQPPENEWIPVGYQSADAHFMGVFDGQGHTISGIYVKGDETERYLGLFAEVYRGATVKNLKIKNSYIEGNQDYETLGCVSSLAGRVVEGNVESVYSEAIVASTSKMTGGLIGVVVDSGNSRISNCWFAGELRSTTNTGGILGGVRGNNKEMCVTMENCLNTGTFYISKGSSQIGALVGVVQQAGVLDLKESFGAGTVVKDSTVKYIGAAIGCIATNKDVGDSVATMEHVYGIKEFGSKLVGVCNGEQSLTDSVALNEQNLSGYSGYRFMKLDFKKDWIIENADATPLLRSYSGNKMMDMEGVTRADTSWYSENGKTFTITTPQQLYGFALLSNIYDFEGQTIKLGKNITINSGTAEELIAKPPVKNTWMPVGYQTGSAVHFKGTFDGQNHTISGAYKVGKENESYIGLFGEIYRGATVKNLKLCNSYFEGNGSSDESCLVGSIAGRMVEGTLSSTYSNAVVSNKAKMTGGLIGLIADSGSSLVSNCWFDGTIYGAINTGGLIGVVKADGKEQLVTMEHCHNTGALYISDGASQIGGLVGAVQQLGNLKLTDSLNVGTIETEGTVKYIGSAIGIISYNKGVGNSFASLENVYGVKEFSANILGKLDGDITEIQTSVIPEVNLKGYSGYRLADLEFGTFWTIEDIESKPMLTAFGSGNVLNTSAMIQADTDWYNEDDKNFTIHTAAELMGLSELSRKYDFEGQTIYLGQSIAFNENVTVEAMMKNAPANWWTPIGFYADGTGPEFKGTFDGQGNTISGLYIVTNEQNYIGLFGTIGAGGTVQNLKITESYFKNTYSTTTNATNYAYMGSVTGVLRGTLDSVYSEVALNNASQYTGGIAGIILGSENGGEYCMNNCWFAGTITTESNKGGGIAGAVDGNNVGIQATISHCLNSGTITTSAKMQHGGICGIVLNEATLYLTDTLNVGSFTTTNEGASSTGSIVGLVYRKSDTLVVNNVYGYASENAWNNVAIGTNGGKLTEEGNLGVMSLDNMTGQKAYTNTELNWYHQTSNPFGYWIVESDTATPVLCEFVGYQRERETLIEPDTTWYHASETDFHIDTAAELLGLSVLSRDYDFSGQNIYLDADIILSNKTVEQMKHEAPLTTWTPIGQYTNETSSGKVFKGTFDGQGHSISGLYAASNTQKRLGLFGTVANGGVVENVKILNSYFKNTYSTTSNTTNVAYMGSVAGVSRGTIHSVYSEAELDNASQYTGGIVGMISGSTEGGEYIITNCWYAGTITTASNKGGGIAGSVNGNNVGIQATISHCLNSGTITTSAKMQHGGICGIVFNKATLYLTDTLNVGSFTTTNEESSSTGSIVGLVNSKSDTLVVNNVYGYASENAWNNVAIGKNGGKLTEDGDFEVLTLERMMGDNADELLLDWYDSASNTDGHWFLNSEKQPVIYNFKEYFWRPEEE